jgi:hypothetical protein
VSPGPVIAQEWTGASSGPRPLADRTVLIRASVFALLLLLVLSAWAVIFGLIMAKRTIGPYVWLAYLAVTQMVSLVAAWSVLLALWLRKKGKRVHGGGGVEGLKARALAKEKQLVDLWDEPALHGELGSLGAAVSAASAAAIAASMPAVPAVPAAPAPADSPSDSLAAARPRALLALATPSHPPSQQTLSRPFVLAPIPPPPPPPPPPPSSSSFPLQAALIPLDLVLASPDLTSRIIAAQARELEFLHAERIVLQHEVRTAVDASVTDAIAHMRRAADGEAGTTTRPAEEAVQSPDGRHVVYNPMRVGAPQAPPLPAFESTGDAATDEAIRRALADDRGSQPSSSLPPPPPPPSSSSQQLGPSGPSLAPPSDALPPSFLQWLINEWPTAEVGGGEHASPAAAARVAINPRHFDISTVPTGDEDLFDEDEEDVFEDDGEFEGAGAAAAAAASGGGRRGLGSAAASAGRAGRGGGRGADRVTSSSLFPSSRTERTDEYESVIVRALVRAGLQDARRKNEAAQAAAAAAAAQDRDDDGVVGNDDDGAPDFSAGDDDDDDKNGGGGGGTDRGWRWLFGGRSAAKETDQAGAQGRSQEGRRRRRAGASSPAPHPDAGLTMSVNQAIKASSGRRRRGWGSTFAPSPPTPDADGEAGEGEGGGADASPSPPASPKHGPAVPNPFRVLAAAVKANEASRRARAAGDHAAASLSSSTSAARGGGGGGGMGGSQPGSASATAAAAAPPSATSTMLLGPAGAGPSGSGISASDFMTGGPGRGSPHGGSASSSASSAASAAAPVLSSAARRRARRAQLLRTLAVKGLPIPASLRARGLVGPLDGEDADGGDDFFGNEGVRRGGAPRGAHRFADDGDEDDDDDDEADSRDFSYRGDEGEDDVVSGGGGGGGRAGAGAKGGVAVPGSVVSLPVVSQHSTRSPLFIAALANAAAANGGGGMAASGSSRMERSRSVA